jgi:hypothetical protein
LKITAEELQSGNEDFVIEIPGEKLGPLLGVFKMDFKLMAECLRV